MENMSSGEETNEILILTKLAEREIRKIELMEQPVVRVCGPLTSGARGYEENAQRLARAEKILEAQGKSVWTFGEAEEEIFGKGFNHGNIFTYFHEAILRSHLIKEAYFLPGWEDSNGASLERETCKKLSIDIQEFPETWFQEVHE